LRIKYAPFLIVLCFLTTGCYATITGAVVNAETGEPVEGAVVLVEWTVTKGLGLTYTKSHEVIEVITDKDGKATISGVFNPFVNPPHVTIYKKGYVAWNNEYIFPDYKHREDFKWKDGVVVRMERFKEGYSYNDHISFIHDAIRLGLGEKKLILKAIDWEEEKAFKEREKRFK